MSPPDLSGNTPVTDVFKPVQINLIKTLRYKLKLTGLNRFNRRFCKLFHADEPLLFHHWLNRCMTSVMSSYIMRMRNNLHKISLLFKISNHCFSCLVAIHARIFSTIFLIDRCIIIHHIDLWKIVTFSNFKVIWIMRRCDLHSAGSEFFIYIIICNDWNLTICQRKNTFLSYDIFVSLIIRMYCNRSIAKHSLRTSCCDLKVVICSNDWIFDMPEASFLLFMLNLGIRKRSLTYRTPVDNSGAFVNISFFI